MINMRHINPQLILSCVIGYYLLIKVAGRGLTATFDISTVREVAYLVATISVGSYLITNIYKQLLKNMPAPKIMYGVSEPIEEEEEEEEQQEEQEEEEEEEEEEDDSSDSDYVPPKSRRRPAATADATAEATTNAITDNTTDNTADNTATATATADTTKAILDPDTTFPTPL